MVYGPAQPISHWFIRWSPCRFSAESLLDWRPRGDAGSIYDRLNILKAHRTVASLLRRCSYSTHRAHQGGLNSDLPAICDECRGPCVLQLPGAGQQFAQGDQHDECGALLRRPTYRPLARDRGGRWVSRREPLRHVGADDRPKPRTGSFLGLGPPGASRRTHQSSSAISTTRCSRALISAATPIATARRPSSADTWTGPSPRTAAAKAKC